MRMRLMSNDPRYAKYKVGQFTYGNPRIEDFGGKATLEIGSFCSFARDVTILLSGEHRTDWVTTSPLAELLGDAGGSQNGTKGDVRIGSDVWVGLGATILGGVAIGHGAVIGAQTVLGGSVPPYAVVAGNPARFIRWRFDDEEFCITLKRWPCVGEKLGVGLPKIAERLLAIAWWDWPIEKIREFLPLLLSDRIEEFLDKAEAAI